jgi:hypothetical protein
MHARRELARRAGHGRFAQREFEGGHEGKLS